MTDVIFFGSDQRVGAIRPDGSDESYPEFSQPNQVSWQMGAIFPDGCRAALRSQEPPKNPDASYYDKDGAGHATSHLWLYDFAGRTMQEIDLPSSMGVAAILPGSERFLVSGNIDWVGHVFTCDLTGGDRQYIYKEPGFAYGTTVSPDATQMAHHVVGAPGRPLYEIYVIDIRSKECRLIASDPEYCQFGPVWSPDGRWLLYQRCAHQTDPSHERSDVVISRADGSEHRVLTTGQRHWFGTSYGTPERRGSGSNCPAWSPDGRWIVCSLLLPDSRTAWVHRPDRPDTDHFNRDYHPEQARGGTQVCLIDPETGEINAITHDDPSTWNFRPAWSPDSQRLAFARADVGAVPGLWVMAADGSDARLLTRGFHERGADYFRWTQLATWL